MCTANLTDIGSVDKFNKNTVQLLRFISRYNANTN